MLVSEKGQVTIPKHIRAAAGVAAGSEVAFSLKGGTIVITPVATSVRNDRRAELRAAAARVRGSLSVEFRPDVRALDALLDVYDTLRSPMPGSCAALAAAAFGLYRRRGGARQLPLPDFFIGAHAAVANLSVLTRDPAGYATYFPRLAVVGP